MAHTIIISDPNVVRDIRILAAREGVTPVEAVANAVSAALAAWDAQHGQSQSATGKVDDFTKTDIKPA